jgi:hypothetical protein
MLFKFADNSLVRNAFGTELLFLKLFLTCLRSKLVLKNARSPSQHILLTIKKMQQNKLPAI